MSATGFVHRHCPDSLARDEVVELVRLGLAFRAQRVGRRPGALRRAVEAVVAEHRPASFGELVRLLEFEALRGQHLGTSPILRVDTARGTVRYLEAGTERECSLKRIANLARLRSPASG